MAARPSIGIVTQIGKETTPGTAVAAGKKFPGLQITLTPAIGVKSYRPNGIKVKKVGTLNTISSKGTYEGPLTYGELVYPLAGYMNLVSSTQIGSTGAYTHVLRPNSATIDSILTYTLQKGDASAAQQVANAIFNSVNINITRQEATVSGSIIAKKINNGATLSATPTTLENIPVSMNDVDIFLDTTNAGLGTTRLTDVFRVSIALPEKFVEKWVLNTTETAWKDAVEVPTEPKITIMAEFNSQMRAIYDALTADALPTRFIRVQITGENIGVGADYAFKFDCAVKLADNGAREMADESGVYGYELEFDLYDDADLGRPYDIALINKISAL